MKRATLSNPLLYLILALLCVSSIGCGPNFGEKLVVRKTEIYYKDGATEADAQRLGEVLEKLMFIDGKRKSVQLLKRDDVWEFRIAVGKVADSEVIKQKMKLYCLELSGGCFDGETVEVHICNRKLESKSVVKGLRGKRHQLEKSVYYYEDVTLEQVLDFSAIPYATQLDPGVEMSYHLSQSGDVIEIRAVHPNADDKLVAGPANDTAVATSNKVFSGKQVDVLICDPFFTEKSVYSSVKKAAATPAP